MSCINAMLLNFTNQGRFKIHFAPFSNFNGYLLQKRYDGDIRANSKIERLLSAFSRLYIKVKIFAFTVNTRIFLLFLQD